VKSPSKIIIKGKNLSLTVNYSTAKVNMNVSVSKNASWNLYRDSSCKHVISNHCLKLKVGKNTAYVKVFAEDSTSTKIYKVNITRINKSIKKTVVIATNLDFADSYAGNVLAKKLGGKIVTCGYSDKEVENIVKHISKNYSANDKIYIIGLGKAIRSDVGIILKRKGYKHIIRIGGENKYETAQLISKCINPLKGTSVVLVNGDKVPADGKNINSICAVNEYPILFVKTDSLTPYTIKALKRISPDIIYIAGDQTQISSKTLKELQQKLSINKNNIIRMKSSNDFLKY
jgi:hypothetical protein